MEYTRSIRQAINVLWPSRIGAPMDDPKLRKVDKVRPPYQLGMFPKNVIIDVAKQIVYLLHTRGEARLEGSDWERIFATAINAEWKPSNVGLDDVRLDGCCWGAKTVKATHPATVSRVRLISGRNSLDYSYNANDPRQLPPGEVGNLVLRIWNARVESILKRFAHSRTVVLVKNNDLTELALFETETVRFDPERYRWSWNQRRNLEGSDEQGIHRFTWQPHGSQFTIVEDIPPTRRSFRLRKPPPMNLDDVLRGIGFDETWVEIIN